MVVIAISHIKTQKALLGIKKEEKEKEKEEKFQTLNSSHNFSQASTKTPQDQFRDKDPLSKRRVEKGEE